MTFKLAFGIVPVGEIRSHGNFDQYTGEIGIVLGSAPEIGELIPEGHRGNPRMAIEKRCITKPS
jgi:hypothetical protein